MSAINDHIHSAEGKAEAIPYHALFCEIVSSFLGVKCVARVAIPALLDEPLSEAIAVLIRTILFDGDEDVSVENESDDLQ